MPMAGSNQKLCLKGEEHGKGVEVRLGWSLNTIKQALL